MSPFPSKTATFSLFFIFVFALSSFSSSQPTSPDVLLLLNTIRPALEGAAAANAELSSWNTSLPLCLWRGLRWSAGGSAASALRCDNDSALRSNLSLSLEPSLRLLSIRLPAAALAGSLPPELGQFSFLEALYLGVNSLKGTIPLELGNAPALAELDLAENALDGALPPSIWNLCGRLILLRVHGNNLSGNVPDPADPSETCARLRVLDLGRNRFQGPFPEFIGGFRELTDLDLSSNNFSGSIPDSIGGFRNLQRLNLTYNNFTGPLPASFQDSRFTAEAFQGNNPGLCGRPLDRCGSSPGLSSGAIAGIVIGLLAGAVVLASVSIGWVQGRNRRNRARQTEEEEEIVFEEDGNSGDGRLMLFQGGEHLTLNDVLNATGQVMEKTSYGTVYKAKLTDGGNITLRLLREGTCKDQAECLPVVRQLARVRHENLVALRAFYQGNRGEKLLVGDYHPNRTLHDLLHDTRAGKPLLNWTRRHKIAVGVARGLAHLHAGLETPVTHGNVRSKNVLVDEFFVPRLTEFGIDKLLVAAVADEMVSAAKADGYKAPELQRMKKCNARTDVYSFGILLLEILLGKKPGKGTGKEGDGADLPAVVKAAVLEEATMEVFDMEVMKGVKSPMEEGLVQALKLAMGCCAPVAAVRPDMSEVVKQLEENRPRNRSALYTPTDRSEIGTPF
ncbi:putative kinase-like protein TMKL1 [Zingiber officinale]|uniref:putative kinase-like protein TMKL1 n=1 Tax=Zingiber officinale TaxID=94328 RepID=UPI001C4B2359|nr:putative kinase-like protein TMKL1 [Zingiber officinale]